MIFIKVGLIDVDGKHFPNLALMKISAYHKSKGDDVEWWSGFKCYDRVYMSKVFTFSPDIETVIRADEIIQGGTGYKDYGSLPNEIETMYPDYSIYPYCDHALGFLTRGCIRKCPWCIVPKKEGYIHPAAKWQDIKRNDSKKIVFMDNNVLACDHGIAQIEELGHQKIWIDFNQALDARLITPEIAKLLSKCKWIRYIRMACDTSEMLPVIKQATSYLLEAGVSKNRFWAYALIQDVQESHKRIIELEKMGVNAFAQPYRDFDGGEPTKLQKDLARWCNMKATFKSCTFEEYLK